MAASEERLEPGLYVVATPIGNLEDMTLRALRVLRGVRRIACEDTRQTQKLLNHFQIATPTVSYHEHNEMGRAEQLVAELREGAAIAVVSDAGTPAIADPGAHLVAAAVAAGVRVFPVPGANAAIAALSASGLVEEGFCFHGFLPAKAGQRRTLLEGLARGETHVFYEAPHRVVEALEDVAAVLGESQPVVLGRELTKLHEEFLRGGAGELAAELKGRASVRGEFVVVLRVGLEEAVESGLSLAAEVRALMVAEELGEMDALKRVAKGRGMGKSEAYREWQREMKRR